MKYIPEAIVLILSLSLLVILQSPAPGQKQDGVQRYLFGALHNSEHFPDTTEQGIFIYDIANDHEFLEKFPAEDLGPHRDGWGGVSAHAGTGRLVHINDKDGIRCFDILEKKLLWERGKATEADQEWASAEKGRNINERAFGYIDRRTGITRDGKYLLAPDRDSARKRNLGVPVVRVLDMTNGEWVKNIPLVDPTGEDKSSWKGNPHHLQAMRKYIYASKWNDGHVYLIDPKTLEVVRRIGPVTLYEKTEEAEAAAEEDGAVSEGAELGYEPDHQSQSIQHFSVSPDEKYVFVEPVKAFGLGIIDVESGKYLGNWENPKAWSEGIQKERFDAKMKGNQLHSKANHGIAVRPGTTEVWMTDDKWGLLHVWDVSQLPPRHIEVVPVYSEINERVMDFSWVNFSIEGDYCYAFNKVIDAETREIVTKLHGLNESGLEIQIHAGKVVRTGHGCGSGLASWVEGYDIEPTADWAEYRSQDLSLR